MDKDISYFNKLMTTMNAFNYGLPYFKPHGQDLYVMIPTPNPMMLGNDVGQGKKDDSVEEILPDFRCNVCSAVILTYSELQAHLLTHEVDNSAASGESSDKPPSSNDPPLKSVEKLKNHPSIIKPLESSDDFEALCCPHCSETFSFRPDLAGHVVLKHKITEDVICVICKSSFASIPSLRKHLMMFHCKDKDRRQCPYCSYRCFQSSDLEKHVARRHTRDFKYKCLFCVKGFATPKELKNHEARKHSVDLMKAIVMKKLMRFTEESAK